MSDENNKILEEKSMHLWFDNSPLVLCSMKLTLEPDDGGLYAYARFMNIQPDRLRSLTVDIICYDAVRREIDRIENYTYSGIDIGRNEEFGYNRKIPMNNPETRNIEFVLKEITNTADQKWVNEGNRRFDKSLEQQNIYTVLGDLNKQFIDVCTRNGINSTKLVFQPIFGNSYWLCACGCFNWGAEHSCYDCGSDRDWLRESVSEEYLLKQKEKNSHPTIDLEKYGAAHEAEERRKQRAEFEKRQQEYHQQQKAAKTPKVKPIKCNYGSGSSKTKMLIIVLVVIAVVAALALGVVKLAIPYFSYANAKNAMSDGRYDTAIIEFKKLDGFLDSKEQLLQAIYGKAENVYSLGDKTGAAELYRSIEDYSDSKEKYNRTQYEIANQYIADDKYMEAAKILEGLGNYKDSSDLLNQCFDNIYQQAVEALKNNRYNIAYESFGYLGDYKDSVQYLNQCIYKKAGNLYKKQQYAEAIKAYESIRDYQDTDKILEKLRKLKCIISAAKDGSPAIWSTDGMLCFLCNDSDSATYTLSFDANGNYEFKITCENHDGNVKLVTGKYKIEDNTVYIEKREDGNTKWEKMLEIESVKELDKEIEGKNTMIILTNPFRRSQNITVYGNNISDESISFD